MDFATNARASADRERKAKTLARWCYERGIGPAVIAEPAEILNTIARRAGVHPPHWRAGHSLTWQRVVELLEARVAWDQAHNEQPPPAASCIGCVVLEAACPRCRSAGAPNRLTSTRAEGSVGRCRVCHGRLDPVLEEHGTRMHPNCEPSHVPGRRGRRLSASSARG